jgi:hypothetical protein
MKMIDKNNCSLVLCGTQEEIAWLFAKEQVNQVPTRLLITRRCSEENFIGWYGNDSKQYKHQW